MKGPKGITSRGTGRTVTLFLGIVPIVLLLFLVYQLGIYVSPFFVTSASEGTKATDMPLSFFANRTVYKIMPLGDSITSSVYPPAKVKNSVLFFVFL